MSKAVYSLIQFCPDLGRQEMFNVGLVVFRRDPFLIDVRIARGFGTSAPGGIDVDQDLFEATKRAFAMRLEDEAHRFRGAEDLASFRASGTNPLLLTSPREMLLHDPGSDLSALFHELVGGEMSLAFCSRSDPGA